MGPRSGRSAPFVACVSESTKSVSRGNSSVSVFPAAETGSAAAGSSIGPRSNPRSRSSRDHTSPCGPLRSVGGLIASSSMEGGDASRRSVSGLAPVPASIDAVSRHVTRSPRVARAGLSSLRSRTWVLPEVSARSTTRRGAPERAQPARATIARMIPREARVGTKRSVGDTDSAPVGALLEVPDQLGSDGSVGPYADTVGAREEKGVAERLEPPRAVAPPFPSCRRDAEVHHANGTGLQITRKEETPVRNGFLERVLHLHRHDLVAARQELELLVEGIGEPVGDEEHHGTAPEHAAEKGERRPETGPRSLRLERHQLPDDPERPGAGGVRAEGNGDRSRVGARLSRPRAPAPCRGVPRLRLVRRFLRQGAPAPGAPPRDRDGGGGGPARGIHSGRGSPPCA